MRLLVDDMREIKADVIIRTFTDAIIFANKTNLTEWELLLDHDLGCEIGDGYVFINHLIRINNVPKTVLLVTANPVGRDNIGRALVDYGYKGKIGHAKFSR